jgi:oligopeptide/dipeptide ABC transporter ATP-binding protein
MYAGKIMERALVMDVFDSPAHPYTKALLDAAFGLQDLRKRKPIPGEPPNLAHLPPGCSFHPRCEYADDPCRSEEPPEVALGPARSAKCWHPVKG